MSRKQIPEINAGSMADIAFLLLIFFLVTASIETDVGLNRMLPSDKVETTVAIKSRNLFEIHINGKDELMVADDEIIELAALKERVLAFIDNGGVKEGPLACSYCTGQGRNELSEHPTKAVISLQTQRNTGYPMYVAVQNEVIGAYNALRNSLGLQLFGMSFDEMKAGYEDDNIGANDKLLFKERIKKIQELYPQKILEVAINNELN